jgi:predicted RNA-binding protein with PIN domain
MSIHIIVDGYNLIRQSNSFRHLDQQSIELGRDALIESLAEYKRLKSHKITVVFDGARAPYPAPSRDRLKGIRVQFSRSGQSADSVIIGMARAEREKALVVSSDREVVRSSEAFGAATVSAEDFENKIALALETGEIPEDHEETEGWRPTTKKKGPRRRLPRRERRSRKKINKL